MQPVLDLALARFEILSQRLVDYCTFSRMLVNSDMIRDCGITCWARAYINTSVVWSKIAATLFISNMRLSGSKYSLKPFLNTFKISYKCAFWIDIQVHPDKYPHDH